MRYILSTYVIVDTETEIPELDPEHGKEVGDMVSYNAVLGAKIVLGEHRKHVQYGDVLVRLVPAKEESEQVLQ